MTHKRKRGNGEGTVFNRADDGPYYISWYDTAGTRKTVNTKTTDKQAAQRVLAKKLADVALRRNGIIDERVESLSIQSQRPVEEHLANFEAMLVARQRSADHIKRTVGFVREICAAAGFEKASDISADGVNMFVADMWADDPAARTVQARVVAIKAFSRWLADHGKLFHDPLRSVKRTSVKDNRRLRRRMLLPAEWPYLKAATLAGGVHHGMKPSERVALYKTAIQTGLRSDELRSLSKAYLCLAGKTPYVRCLAQRTKNGKEARQYIEADLVAELRALTATKAPAAPVFNLPDEWDMATMLRTDLKAARKQWLDEVKHDPEAFAKRSESDFLADCNHQGEVFDFHALRHTTGAWLALKGIHVSVIKTVMRHSTITLTMDTYGHLLPEQHSDSVGVISEMLAEPLAATGTAGVAVETAVGVRKMDPAGATKCDTVRVEGQNGGNVDARKPLRNAKLCRAMQEGAIGRDGTRTHTPLTEQGILSPQCLPFHHAAVSNS